MINCKSHDYIEIVCMYRYPIKITMKTGEIIKCIAFDTHYNSIREECIKVKIDALVSEVILDNISTLEISVKNPHFEKVSFS